MNKWISTIRNYIGSMSLMLIVLPEFNPVDMTYRQVRTYLENPSLTTSAPVLESTESFSLMGSYPLVAGLSIVIVLFSVISVYFHNRKKKEANLQSN
jgi:hypothetical protein